MFGKTKQSKDIVYNLDKEPVIDIKNGQFLLPFDDRQQTVLEHLLTLGAPVNALAYKGFPAEMMLYVAKYAIPNWWAQIPSGTEKYNKKMDKNEFAIWEIVHTDFQYVSQFVYACRLLDHGINILEEMKDAVNYSSEVWRDISYLMDYEQDDYISYVNHHGAAALPKLDEKFSKAYFQYNSADDYAADVAKVERYNRIAYWKFLEGKYTFNIYDIDKTPEFLSSGDAFIARYYQKFPLKNQLIFE